MLRSRLSPAALPEAARGRPRWLTHGLVNLAVLCALIVLVGMLSPRMGRSGAGITFFVGLGISALAAGYVIGITRRLAGRFHMPSPPRSSPRPATSWRTRAARAARR
jgi:hypothetical protein